MQSSTLMVFLVPKKMSTLRFWTDTGGWPHSGTFSYESIQIHNDDCPFSKNCTGFPYQSVLNTKLLACVSMLSLDLVHPISLIFYTCILPLAISVHPQIHAYSDFNDTNARAMVSVRFLISAPSFGIISLMISGTVQLLSFKVYSSGCVGLDDDSDRCRWT